MTTPEEELYVLVCDTLNLFIFEQKASTSLEAAVKRQETLGNTYGKTRIARLQFVEG